ncbi:MAG: LysM domain-containing protein [Dehalococcoidia bacterium]|nr:LysM domain-containing protein [Dehalococcoidia bacterium]
MLQASGLAGSAFPPTSRYHGIELATYTHPDGTVVAFARRRFIPPPEQHALLQEHRVAEGERLDILAARFLGDPEQFWRLCDANAVLDPAELEQPGTVVRVTLPGGFPGAQP